MLYSLIVSLLLTLIIEITVSYILGIRSIYDIKIVILVNFLTNPFVVYIANIVLSFNNLFIYYIFVLILELYAVFMEGYIYYKKLENRKINGFELSLINNLCSYGLGVVFNIIQVLILKG